MVKLKLQDKKGNQKYFLFDAKKQNHIIFRELNLKNFNILTDVECISESAFGYISIETILTLYKNDKYAVFYIKYKTKDSILIIKQVHDILYNYH